MISWRSSAVALAGLALFACRDARETAAAPQPSPAVTLPIPEPPLDREALLMAAIRAGSAAAAGEDDGEPQRLLDGKRFELRLRFGCAGPAAVDKATRSWSFDDARRVLRIKVRPEISGATPPLDVLGARQFEAVEGFWITRPWLLTATCPRSAMAPGPIPATASDTPTAPPTNAPNASPLAAASHQLGIVQLFTADDPRTHRRRDRGYEVTKTLAEGTPPSNQGYDLVIAGRLKRIGDGPVIACATQEAFSPPNCIISAQFDRVAVVHPATGELLADWAGAS